MTSTALLEDVWWEAIVDHDAELIAVSPYVADSRVYRRGRAALKIRRGHSPPKGMLALDREAALLGRLGVEVAAEEGDDWASLIMPWVDGLPLERRLGEMELRERLLVLLAVGTELRRLHRDGVAHRDLRPDNILVDEHGRVVLIDFDRAIEGGGGEAALADWVGVSSAGASPWPFWKLGIAVVIPRSKGLYHRLSAPRRSLARRRRPTSAPSSDIELLQDAWDIARLSDANAPGKRLAYYTFTYKGRHFVGERPWALRWEMVKAKVDFRGKRVLELGCNLGLLSCFASLSGAAEVRGIDHDDRIIEAAEKVAEALGATATFSQRDLMAEDDWEQEYAGADLVTALSLVNWLPDPDRVFRFLGKHDEVLFEGHESLETETLRLLDVGFDEVTVLGETERGRHLLHAHKRR